MPFRWLPEHDQLLVAMTDTEVAAKLGCSTRTVFRRRKKLGLTRRRAAWSGRPWSTTDTDLLGTAPDADIAERLWRTVKAVRQRRLALGIPPIRVCHPQTADSVAKRTAATRPWTPQEISLLGTDYDKNIGIVLGRSLQSVAGKRLRLGISSYGRG